jgi:catechol 2,3-dioxygenase-like lactoylglutathione lyase family enzyme
MGGEAMSAVIDHVGISATEFERSRMFYTAALGTLGIKELWTYSERGESHVGYGRDRPTFWLGSGKQHRGEAHIAFAAASRAEVEAFHVTALANGGRDNGKPGLRAHYHPNYYGAFVLDPDGHNIEAVYHGG